MEDKPSLARLQSWMQAVVTDPGGVRHALEGGAARGALDVSAEEAESVVTRSSSLSALERLEIYNRSYHARLLDCFRAEFPCLLHACGEALFTRFVADYLRAHPPSGYTLNRLSERFPAHLAATRPRAEAGQEPESWPDFLIDLATLERTFAEVYDGPGDEDDPPPAPAELGLADQINALAPVELAEARLRPSVSLRLLACRYPVAEYFTAVRSGQVAPLPDPRPTHLALHRVNWVVQIHPLAADPFRFLQALAEGETVAGAAMSATPTGTATPSTPRETKAWLLTLAEAGLVRELART